METRIQYNHRTQQKPYKYTLPANPRERYDTFDRQTAQILKQTERCPFPKIRQLIILFNLDLQHEKNKRNSNHPYNPLQTKLLFGSLIPNHMTNSVLPHASQKMFKSEKNNDNFDDNLEVININKNYPDILKQAYSADLNKKKNDDILVNLIEEQELAKLKLQKLLDCTERYNQFYKKVTESLEDDYRIEMREIEKQNRENDEQARNIEQEVLEDNKAMNEETRMRKRVEIQKQIGKKRLELYYANKVRYETTNEKVLEIENDFFSYTAYSQEFEKALIIASAAQTPHFRVDKSMAHRRQFDNTLILVTELHEILNKMENFQEQVTDYLFDYRQKSKNPVLSVTQTSQSMIKSRKVFNTDKLVSRWQQLQNELNLIYSKLASLSKRLSSDRQQCRHIFDDVTELYPTFIKSYSKAQQVYKISSKNTLYQEMIRQEKNNVQLHLKKNYGMIVPYVWTEEFGKNIAPLQSNQKKYLKELFAQELEPLQVGITYINRQYQKLYKQACEQNSGVRRKIQKYLKDFQRYSEKDIDDNGISQNNFVLHLMESCRKLLRIAK